MLSLWRNHVVCSFTEYSTGHRETTLFRTAQTPLRFPREAGVDQGETSALEEVMGPTGC